MRTLLVLIAFAIALAAPANANAIAVPLGVPSSLALRAQYAGPNAHLASDRITVRAWLVGAIAAAIIVGTCALALWTESRRPDDSDLDGGGGSGGGDPELPPPPAGPGGADVDWPTFEADFWDYVGAHGHRVT